MKRITLSALCVMMLFSLCSCFADFGPVTADLCADNNHDGICDVHHHKVHGGYIHWDDNSDGYCDKCSIKLHSSNMHRDINTDLICDFCYIELENSFVNCFDYDEDGCCDACGYIISFKGECATLSPVVSITVPDSKSDKSAITKISVNISTVLDIYDTITSVTIVSHGFSTDDTTDVAWDKNASLDVGLKFDDIEKTGEIIFKIRTDWKYYDPTNKECDMSHVATMKIFYATDDTHIAFSTVSVEDAQSKLN